MPYDHQAIERKWQERWEKNGLFRADDQSGRQKFYCLIEFPYPSGSGLHVGHVRSYSALDVVARKKRMEGKNVLFPIGWDAFGLPTENYAIKTSRQPQDVTCENTDTFRRQLKALGLSFDWSREINTTDPRYYRWTQWMFLKFFKAGLAYKTKIPINWCPSCRIGLANEEVVGGVCERCGRSVEKREKEQWMIAITKYAERLLEDLATVNYLPKIKKQQEDWIGKSQGVEIEFKMEGEESRVSSIRIFTTRPDTIFGATYLAVSPESAKKMIEAGWAANQSALIYVNEALKRGEIERAAEDREKTGVPTELIAINPANGERIPVWIADYVLGQYGTGAIMAVPAHDERDFAFAEKFDLPKVIVIENRFGVRDDKGFHQVECYSGEGRLINSGEFSGLFSEPAREKIIHWSEEKGVGRRQITYKLRDWVFSRQRYWGEPIPLIHCQRDGWVPVPEEDLPVVLPAMERYEPTETGESPLAAIDDFVNTVCPICGGPAKRETDTMPNWAGSSWYFLAYLMKGVAPDYQLPFADYQSVFKYWLPVDLYNGGMEHTTLHLLYSRFWHKFLFDQGFVPTAEPYARRHSHGVVLAEDGSKMSKSKGNVINPDEIVEQYGADALRLYEMFMGPFEESVPWSTNGLIGLRRFLDRVWSLVERALPLLPSKADPSAVERFLHKTIKKVSDDIEILKFNTAIASLMTCLKTISEAEILSKETFRLFLTLLHPFAPHFSSELLERLGFDPEPDAWPAADPRLVKDETVTVAVSINGKLRGEILLSPESSEEEARRMALSDTRLAKWLAGQTIKKAVYVPGRILNFVI